MRNSACQAAERGRNIESLSQTEKGPPKRSLSKACELNN